MKHYGIKVCETNQWLEDANGMIFWTTSRAVAEQQRLRTMIMDREINGPGMVRNLVVKEFPLG